MGKLTFGQTGFSYECKKIEVKVDGAPKCPRCDQRVYFNEEKKAAGKTWHQKCFTCGNCNKSLDSTNYNQHNGDQILCTNCYRKFCGPQVYGFVSGAVLPTRLDLDAQPRSAMSRICSSEDIKRSSSSETFEKPGTDGCGRCGRRVYFAEEVRVGKKKWHKICFKCGHCSKSIEPGKCNEHDEDLYCQACYSRFFGPKGYGYAAGNGSIFSPEISNDVFSLNGGSRRVSSIENGERYSPEWSSTGSKYSTYNGTREWDEYHTIPAFQSGN